MAIVTARAPRLDASGSRPGLDTPKTWPVAVVGILDASVPFAYALQIGSVDVWYQLTLAMKIVVCLVSMRTIRLGHLPAFSLYGLSAIILISCAASGAQINDYIRIFAFVANLGLTLLIVRRSNLPIYVLACVCTIGFSTLLYIFSVHSGKVDAIWGRYSYFRGTEPNLGSEIIAISVILATCVLSPIRLLMFAVPSLYAISLMQGRSGLMVSIVGLAMKLYFSIENPKTRLLMTYALVLVGFLIFMFWFDNISTLVKGLFLIEDEHRGASTGFTGRDELWGSALKAFQQSPFIGNGVNLNEKFGVEPHNFFLFGLAQFGALSLLIFGMIFFLYFDMFRSNRQWAYGLSAIPILWLFNDRFLNLNPYPFLLYVVLLAHTVASSRQH